MVELWRPQAYAFWREHRLSLGLNHENRYFYDNELLAVTDVSADGDNVLTDGERLYFIDPIIKLKASAVDVLNYYYGVLK